MFGFTNIKANLEELEDIKFDDVTLLEGWHVVKEERSVIAVGNGKRRKKRLVGDWEMRTLDQCKTGVMCLVKDLVKSLKNRGEMGVHEISKKLYDCVDLTHILMQLVGKRTKGYAKPYDVRRLALHGRDEFFELVSYVGKHPHIEEDVNLNFDLVLFATKMQDSLKDAMVSLVWGSTFFEVGSKVFSTKVDGEWKQLGSLLSENATVESMEVEAVDEFQIEPTFCMSILDHDKFVAYVVRLNEEELWRLIYCEAKCTIIPPLHDQSFDVFRCRNSVI